MTLIEIYKIPKLLHIMIVTILEQIIKKVCRNKKIHEFKENSFLTIAIINEKEI